MNQAPAKVNPIVRIFPSLTDLAFLQPVITVFILLEGAGMLLEGDTGWHIRAGEWMLDNRRILDHDIFSFTKTGQPWFAWEWLWDVAFAWLHRQGGLAAVITASLFVLCLMSLLVFRLTLRRSNNRLVAFLICFFAVLATSVHWLARPHLFTLLFTVVTLWILEDAQLGRTKRLIVLPILTVLWANIHGGFLVGILLIACYGAGELVSALTTADREHRRAAMSAFRPYLWTGLACAAASLATPFGWQLHVHIFHYLRDPFLYENISEFRPTIFRGLRALVLEPLFLAGLAAGFWNLTRRRYTDAILLLLWAHLAVGVIRNVPIFVIIAAPRISEFAAWALEQLRQSNLASWIKRSLSSLDEAADDFTLFDRIPRVHLASLIPFAAAALILLSSPATSRFHPGYDSKKYPVDVIAELHALTSDARIFTNDEWGDYLIYRLFPGHKVYVDGRSDFYGADFDNQLIRILSAQHDWESALDRHRVNVILLPVDNPLSATLKETSRWKPVYDDGISILFLKSGEAGSEQISASSTHEPARVEKVGGRAVARAKTCGRTTT